MIASMFYDLGDWDLEKLNKMLRVTLVIGTGGVHPFESEISILKYNCILPHSAWLFIN